MKTTSILLSFLISAGVANTACAQIITTIAGNHVQGHTGDGGQATAAELSQPNEAHFDKNGNIFVADYGSNVVRKITRAGIITTVAGSVTPGYTGDGGQATAATLHGPVDVALDTAGNLFIADVRNQCVRMVNTAGIISTYAGTGTAGFSGDGGPADSAQIDLPSAIALDMAGNLYIVDDGNSCIRKVSTAHIITTIAGNGTAAYGGDGGPATDAMLNNPEDVAVDVLGNVYIADIGNNVVRKVNTAGIISTFAGSGAVGYSGDGGPATAAQMRYPYAVAADALGNVYITDNANYVVRKVNAAGTISTVIGSGGTGYSGDGGPATLATLNNPGGIEVDQAGNLLICDFGNDVVRWVTKPATTAVANVALPTSNTIFTVSPNPAKEVIYVDVRHFMADKMTIGLRDITGKVLSTKTVSAVGQQLHTTIDIAALPAGIYFVEGSADGERFFEKVVKD